MGHNPSKFYASKQNEEYCAVHISEGDLNVMYGDEGAREAAQEAVQGVWTDLETLRLDSYRMEITGSLPADLGLDDRLATHQTVVRKVLQKMSKIGWLLLGFTNLQEGGLFGHTWMFEKQKSYPEKDFFDNCISVNPASGNKLFMFSEDESLLETFEAIVSQKSTEKGVKEVIKFEKSDGIKFLLRHEPWNLDKLVDWWGGSYLICSLFESWKADRLILLQGSPAYKIDDPEARFCMVTPVGSSVLNLRRVPEVVKAELKTAISRVWSEGFLESEDQFQSNVLKMKGLAWDNEQGGIALAIAIFEVFAKHAFRYWSGFRVDSEANSRSAMLFVCDKAEIENENRKKFCGLHLRDGDSLQFHKVDKMSRKQVEKAAKDHWHKGIMGTTDKKISFKGFPWIEEYYAEMLVCGIVQAMRQNGWIFVAGLNVGYGGDILVFQK